MELDSYFRLLTTEWARTCPSPRLSGHASPLHPHRSRVCFARGGFPAVLFFYTIDPLPPNLRRQWDAPGVSTSVLRPRPGSVCGSGF